ncbi:MAG: DDE-type integrase/transposase/recombinase [Rhodobacteraceae bacterium]|nr:DDE-type integrase/transposase/recombinase [Paracoccaceae bacterium]MCF8515907.1 DDE-type integrase/transposase/recombinase [Paracoccaceae bacterium]MCF8520325.1 DDE-type integrase/transposase/recombinase [Paracoccaceae bacterium]
MNPLHTPKNRFKPQYCFSEHDLVVIDGREMQPVFRNSEGVALKPVDNGPAQQISHDEIHELIQHNRLKVRARRPVAGQNLNRLADGAAMSTRIDGPLEERLRFREALVLGFLELQRRQRRDNGRPMPRTDAAIEAHANQIRMIAMEFYAKASEPGGRKTSSLPVKFSARSLRRWLTDYEAHGRTGLVDGYGRSGNRDNRFPAEVRSIIADGVNSYLHRNKPTRKQVTDRIRGAVEALNDTRIAEGLEPLQVPSRNAVSVAIDALDPFLVSVARDGRDAALRRMRQTGRGLSENLVAPLTRVEMDEWKIDLFTLFEENGMIDFFSDEDRKRLGLTGKNVRWWVTVAICATTRMIVGMCLSRTPSQYSAMDCLQLVLNDKGQFADAVGALSPWNAGGRPLLLVTDGGSAFKAADFRAVCADLNIPFEIAVNGLPQMRARIERVFRTMGLSLMPRLSGRSFESAVARGDHDGQGDAALTSDELALALVRWVVDIYHNTPHDGLGGDTPLETWNRLVEDWGVRPAPSLEEQAAIFARPMVRNLEGDGITVLGVRYHSDELARYGMHRRGKKMDIRWSSSDLGAIWVRCDDWLKVPAVFDRFKGVSAFDWISAARRLRLRQRDRQKVSRGIIRQAIHEIEALDAAARTRAGLVTEAIDEKMLGRIEEEVFIGFRVADQEDAPDTTDAGDGVGLVITPAAAPEPSPLDANEEAPVSLRARRAGKEDWDLGD